MATRGLLEADCGGQNPLTQLRSHYTKDRVRLEDGVGRGLHTTQQNHHLGVYNHPQGPDSFVQEFLHENPQISGVRSQALPNTFNMGAMLQEIRQSENLLPTNQISMRPNLADSWVGDFVQEGPKDWSQEFLLNNAPLAASNQTQMDNSVIWTEDYLSSVPTLVSDQTLTNQDIDPEEYREFVNSLAKNSGVPAQSVQVSSDSMVDEFLAQTRSQREDNLQINDDTYKQDFWKNLESEWRELETEDNHPWVQEFTNSYQPFEEYTFQEENSAKENVNALDEGKKKLKEGDIPSAVLLFESAVQQAPELPEAWLLLGKSQAQNEQDNKAISALKRCINIDPGNEEALMSIAVSFTNESYQKQACESLQLWLEYNPEYSHLVTNKITSLDFKSSFMSQDLHEHVTNMYIQAARLRTGADLDPNVQAGLGVLFNLSSDYEKAIDCFRAAVHSKPDDPLLWNRLGATLANGNNSEEAIAAYHSALRQNPGFVRCRYNLGISCINLKAYQSAVEHFLTALNFQATGRGPAGEEVGSTMSETVWSSLRLALSLMNRPDLKELADSRNLPQLSKLFNISLK